MKKAIFIALALVVGLSSCDNKKKIEAGPMSEETRSIDADYSEIHTSGAFDVYILEDQDHDIRIEAGKNLIPHIETRVINNELFIDVDVSTYGNSEARIYINSSVINAYYHEGSGNVQADLPATSSFRLENDGSGDLDFSVDASGQSHVHINGSGNVQLNGSANELICSIRGSGDVHAFDFPVTEADLLIKGSGNMNVSVSDFLKVRIDGSGDVQYIGSPQLDVQITGSGNVNPK